MIITEKMVLGCVSTLHLDSPKIEGSHGSQVSVFARFINWNRLSHKLTLIIVYRDWKLNVANLLWCVLQFCSSLLFSYCQDHVYSHNVEIKLLLSSMHIYMHIYLLNCYNKSDFRMNWLNTSNLYFSCWFLLFSVHYSTFFITKYCTLTLIVAAFQDKKKAMVLWWP